MAPREATLKAMEEVSGPVVGIALILAAVFIPVAFMGGIQGRLNKQFALTIAISVLISAFNALTLSPALAAMLLRPRTHGRWARRASSTRFNRGFERASNGYVAVSARADPQGGCSRSRSWPASRVLAGGLGPRAARPASCPRRTTATSCSTCSCPPRRRCSAPTRCAQGRGDPGEDAGRPGYNAIVGFSLAHARDRAEQRASSSSASSRGTSARLGARGRSSTSSTRAFRAEIPEARGVRDHAAGDPRPRLAGRLQLLAAGPQRRRRSRRLDANAAAVPRRGAQAARAGRPSTRRSARRCRRSSPTSTATRC